MLRNNSTKINTLFVMLILFSILSILWMLNVNNSLTFDDFTTLYNARYKTFDELFHFLPSQTYNDRPIGLMFIKVLNICFGLNAQSYHIIFAIIHIINICLVYKITFVIYKMMDNEKQKYFSIIAAAIFGIYPLSLMSVSWISAVYDILCCLFSLLCIYFYLQAREDKKFEVFNAVISIICYYLAIRTKEMALTLPLILLVFEIWKALFNKKHVKLYWYLVFQILTMCFFTLLLFKSDIETIGSDNPYYQSFNIFNLIKNAIKYLFLYFDWSNTGFTFVQYSVSSLMGVVFFIILLLFSIYLVIRQKDFSILLSIICLGISISVVLTMVNMQHRLYLYIPSVFIGITVSIFLYKIINIKHFKYLWEFIIILIPCLYLVNYTPGMIGYKTMWLNYCNKDYVELEQLKKIQKPIEDSNIYVKGAMDNYNIFYYGPGNSMRLIFDDPSINTILVNEFPENPSKPYVFLTYNNNNITEIKRDATLETIEINSIYPEQINNDTAMNEDGTLNIGIVCNKINENLIVVINGMELNTTIGKDFISAIIPRELLEFQQLEVIVKDTKMNIESEKVLINIE